MLVACLLLGKDVQTLPTPAARLQLIGALPWHRLTYAHVNVLRALLADRYGATYANKILSAVRATIKEAWRLGLVDADTYIRAVAVKRIEGGNDDDAAAGGALEPGEQTTLFRTCQADLSPAGPRDAAILWF